MRAERATAALLAVSALLVACVDARLPRTADRKSAMERAEEQGPFHTYYAIIKDEPKARADEDLAKKFRERLGRDSNVHVHRVSESKFVVKIMGDQALVDKIKTAMEAFPEVGQPHSPPAAPPRPWLRPVCALQCSFPHAIVFIHTRIPRRAAAPWPSCVLRFESRNWRAPVRRAKAGQTKRRAEPPGGAQVSMMERKPLFRTRGHTGRRPLLGGDATV